ncbi:MAG: type II toxin-antitoxin system ParD family antitoxin [Opitutae bacterium]|nr:type II toxin-antitoxin system ParD family antitoxin [Opitutae bacterium]
MSRNTSVEIGDELSQFIKGGVKNGRYGSASEMVRAGLRLLQDRETKMAALRAAVQEGIKSGDALPFDFDQFRAARKAKR